MNKNRQLEEAKVTEIREKLKKVQSVIPASYQGSTTEQDTNLRKSLRETDAEYKVYKNTLVTLAAKELGFDGIVEYLGGPISITFSHEDATAPTRILNDFARGNRKFELKVVIVERTAYNEEQTKQPTVILSGGVLLAKLPGSIKSPLSSFAYLLSAIADKKEEPAE